MCSKSEEHVLEALNWKAAGSPPQFLAYFKIYVGSKYAKKGRYITTDCDSSSASSMATTVSDEPAHQLHGLVTVDQ